MIASVTRRFAVAAPRYQPPATAASSVGAPLVAGSSRRVAMMPRPSSSNAEQGATAAAGPGKTLAMTTDADAARPAPASASAVERFDDILAVGRVSAQGEGQKVHTASQADI